MRFNISFANYYAPDSKPALLFRHLSLFGDMTRFLRLALEELGHDVTVRHDFLDLEAMNIVWETFYNPRAIDQLKQLGVSYGLICTEPLEEIGRYPLKSDEEQSRVEWDSFAYAARNAEFVWYLIESAGKICRQLNSNSHFLPFGWVGDYAELQRKSRKHVCDFLITGNVTPRRRHIAELLHRRGYQVLSTGIVPDFIRLSLMAHARAALVVQKTDRHNVFSIARVFHSIMNKVPIVVEYSGPDVYLSPFCDTVSPPHLLDVCESVAKNIELQGVADERYERFASAMPMRPIMELICRQTFGGHS